MLGRLERFAGRAKVEFVGPRSTPLCVELYVRFGDRVGVERAIFDHRKALLGPVAPDHAVEHHVGHVNALGPELAGQRLGQTP